MSLKLNSSANGSVTLQEPVTANNRTLTLPDMNGTVVAADGSGNSTIAGTLTAGAGTFSGALSGTTGTFSGNVSGANGTFSGDLSFNSGYGSSAVAYGIRAYINFGIDVRTGTFSQSASTTVSISITAHGLVVGQTITMSFTALTGSAPASGNYTVTSVTNANAFTITAASSGTGTGDAFLTYYLRLAKNVSSVVDNGVGDVTLTFTNAFPDTYYMMAGTAAEGFGSGDGACVIGYDMGTTALTLKTTTQARINIANNGADDNIDSADAEIFFVR